MSGFSVIYSNMDIFLLVLVRVSSFVFVSPVFGRKGIPTTTKIGLSILLASTIMLGFNEIPVLSGNSDMMYIMLVAKEADRKSVV